MQEGMTSFVNSCDDVEVMMFDQRYRYTRGADYIRNIIRDCMEEFVLSGIVQKRPYGTGAYPNTEYIVIKKP